MVRSCRGLHAVSLVFVVFFISNAVNAQRVTITSPGNKALFQQVGNRADIPVCVTTIGVPTGGGVQFVLDDRIVSPVQPRRYSLNYQYVFRSVPIGEHTITAYMIGIGGRRLPYYDRRTQIGVGDLVVAVGDSITAGEDDDIAGDNWSYDGRVGPYTNPVNHRQYGGCLPLLNNMLTTARRCPHCIINAGKGGERIAGAQVRIVDLVRKYPNAKTWLVAYGSNDANAGLSYNDFHAGLQNVVDTIRTAIPSAKIYIPKIFYGGSSLDPAITNYNNVMGDIIRNTPDVYWGADLDTMLRSNHARYDHLSAESGTWFSLNPFHHPNGYGVQRMAVLWRLALLDRAIVVADGVVPSAGNTWADKIYLEELDAVGLNPNNLLLVIERPPITSPPPMGTKLVGNWWARVKLTGALEFPRGYPTATVRLERLDFDAAGVTSANQIWLARDNVLLPTSRIEDTNNCYFTAVLDKPGRITTVADTIPPQMVCRSDPPNPDGEDGWYATVPRITLTAADNTGLAVGSIRYKWDSKSEVKYTGPFTASKGTHTLYYYAIDQSGNRSAVNSRTFMVSSTAVSAVPRYDWRLSP